MSVIDLFAVRLIQSVRFRDLGNLIVSHEFLPSKRGFKLALLNINSLSAHIDELRILLSDRPIDVLAVNESKLDDTISDNEIHISGYESIRSDRSTNGRSGGGVCFFIRSEINYSVRSDLINLVPRSLVDEAEGEIWPNPICIT